MKKLFSVLLAILLVIGISAPAYADLGPPYFKEYQVRVINKDGAPFIYGDTVVPYDTVLTVTGDYIEDDGTITLSVSYNDDWGSILASDTALLEDGVHYSEGIKLSYPKSYVVIESGVYLYKGPGFGYETTGEEIPVGTEFDCYYAISDSSDCAWAYTTIDGIGGWIYIYPYFRNSVACRVNNYSIYGNDLFIVKEGVRLLEFTDGPSNEISGDIPVGTRLTFKYYIDDVKNSFFLVEYDGKQGWISADEWYNDSTENKVAISKITTFFINSGSYPVYSEIGNTESEIIGTVESNTTVKTIYSCLCEYSVETSESNYEFYQSSWYGVEVDGQLGWINVTQDWDYIYVWDYIQYTATEDDVEIYESADSSNAVGTIPAGKDLIKLIEKDYKCYVSYNGIEGWVDTDKIEPVVKSINEYGFEEHHYHSARDFYSGRLTAERLEAVRLGKEIVYEEDETLSPSPDAEESSTKKYRRSKDDSAGFSQTQLIILCAAAVAIVVLTAAVTIILVNRKNK